MISSPRLLGIALIVGGILVGIIIVVLLASYREAWTGVITLIATVAAFGLLVLPQLALGIYLLWHSAQNKPHLPKDRS
jgi:hypothetical protein